MPLHTTYRLLCVVSLAICCLHNVAGFDVTNTTRPLAGNVAINGDVNVKGQVTAQNMKAANVTVVGTASISEKVSSSVVLTDLLVSGGIETPVLRSPTGVVTVDGDLQITSVSAATVSTTAFLVQGIRQWSLAQHDDFNSPASLEGWSRQETSSCLTGQPDRFLGGHCQFAGDTVSKTFRNLPPHSFVRLTARFHMLDNWSGESAFLKIDDKIQWADTGIAPSHPRGLNVCGSESADPKFSVPIDVTVPHTADTAKVTFASTLEGHPCHQSWGVDDVMIYVK